MLGFIWYVLYVIYILSIINLFYIVFIAGNDNNEAILSFASVKNGIKNVDQIISKLNTVKSGHLNQVLDISFHNLQQRYAAVQMEGRCI